MLTAKKVIRKIDESIKAKNLVESMSVLTKDQWLSYSMDKLFNTLCTVITNGVRFVDKNTCKYINNDVLPDELKIFNNDKQVVDKILRFKKELSYLIE